MLPSPADPFRDDPLPAGTVPAAHQRAQGCAEVAVSHRRGETRLDRLFQRGCGKALMPATHGRPSEVVFVNTSGGVTGGDRLDWALTAGPGTRLVGTTQAAERIYRASSGTAKIATRLDLGSGAWLDWLPRETILFDGARLDRDLDVAMAIDSRLTLIEITVLGRAAMGERLTSGRFADNWRVRRDRRLVHAEALRLDGDLARATGGVATLGGIRAMATLLHVAPEAEARLDATRAALGELPDIAAAASARDGKLLLRFAAADNAPLRAALIRFLIWFRAAPLPRVWSL